MRTVSLSCVCCVSEPCVCVPLAWLPLAKPGAAVPSEREQPHTDQRYLICSTRYHCVSSGVKFARAAGITPRLDLFLFRLHRLRREPDRQRNKLPHKLQIEDSGFTQTDPHFRPVSACCIYLSILVFIAGKPLSLIKAGC